MFCLPISADPREASGPEAIPKTGCPTASCRIFPVNPDAVGILLKKESQTEKDTVEEGQTGGRGQGLVQNKARTGAHEVTQANSQGETQEGKENCD